MDSLSHKMEVWQADPQEGGAGWHCIWCNEPLYVSERIPVLAIAEKSYFCCSACAFTQTRRIMSEAAQAW